MTILVDSNEPEEVVKLIRQSVSATVTPLNNLHMSDYFFGSYEGKRFQFSRKQAGELIGNIDEAEDQLRDYYQQADQNYQIVEGWISPLPIHGIEIRDHSAKSKVSVRDLGSKLYCYQIQPNGHIERGHSFSAVNASMLYAWLHRLDQAGITTYWTINWVETAKLLVAIYRNEQKPPEEHSTLQRVIRPRITVREADPFTKSLLFLSNAYKLDIGEKKVAELTSRYVNLMDIAMASIDDLCQCKGIGKGIAEKLLRALGRTIE